MSLCYNKKLKTVMEKAEEYKKEYESETIISLHIIGAYLWLKDNRPGFWSEEMQESDENIKSMFNGDSDILEKILYYLASFSEFDDKSKIFIKNVFSSLEGILKTNGIDELDVNTLIYALSGDVGSAFIAKNVYYSKNIHLDASLNTAKKLQDDLSQSVFGQDQAISEVASAMFYSYLKRYEEKTGRLQNAFLFAGAPGVGKTYLAEVLAKCLGRPYMRFDMSGFNEKESIIPFAGADKSYRNGHPGFVTDFVDKNPDCVILFDEIEKAHINVIQLFLQILDQGEIKDIYSEKMVSFREAIVIMTTNAGASLYESASYDPSVAPISQRVFLNALSTELNPYTGAPFFPMAICSRFSSNNMILFNPLGPSEMVKIIKKNISDFSKGLFRNQNIALRRDEIIEKALLYSLGGKTDSRAIIGKVKNFVSTELYSWFKFADEEDKEKVNCTVKIELSADFSDVGEAVKSLFFDNRKFNILLVSENKNDSDIFGIDGGFDLFYAKNDEEVKHIIRNEDIDFVICDIMGRPSKESINIEDSVSFGRKMFTYFSKQALPFYVYSSKSKINNEERRSLIEQNVRGFFDIENRESVGKTLLEIRNEIICSKALNTLAKNNKILLFDTAYEWSPDRKTGKVILQNFKLEYAVDAVDSDNICAAESIDVSFDQVIGVHDAKSELMNFVSYIKNPKAYSKLGVSVPKGVILYGPPGTGKTMLARAMAHEAGATFIPTQATDFLKSKVGEGAREIKRIFNIAKKYAPSIVFIDEIDAIAKDRKENANSEVLNALLTEMDGFSVDVSKPVFVLAATNFDVSFESDSKIDSALLRRFDRRVFVDLPNKEERSKFMQRKLANAKLKIDDDLTESVSIRSAGMSLDNLDSIVDLSLRMMVSQNKTSLDFELLNEAFEKYRFGEKNEYNEKAIVRVAVHEAGHALIGTLCGNCPSFVTVESRGKYGGYLQISEDEITIKTKEEILEEIRINLAGRAAEMVIFGDEKGVSSGAESDLKYATKLCLKMISSFGMIEERGLASTGGFSEKDIEICNDMLAREMENTVKIIEKNLKKLKLIKNELLIKNHISGKEIKKILEIESC